MFRFYYRNFEIGGILLDYAEMKESVESMPFRVGEFLIYDGSN